MASIFHPFRFWASGHSLVGVEDPGGFPAWTVDVPLHQVASIIDRKAYLFPILGLQPCRNIDQGGVRMVTEDGFESTFPQGWS